MHFCAAFCSRFLLFILLITGLTPGISAQKHFQQKVNYTIQVALNDQRHELKAFETIEYINNSPDTLRFLYFHLWPNAYSNNTTALAKQLFRTNGKQKLFKDPELRGSIDSLDFRINGEKAEWSLLPGQPDICQILLNKPLIPGDSINISTPFRVTIPKGISSRLGHIGQSYQISQWFPKPAVYDQTGWHQMSYLDQGEFYSEFGDFDVSITLPENYTVGASGNLNNVRETERLDSLAADTTRTSTISSKLHDFPPSSPQLKTLRYTGQQIHDFAWFADKRFHVLKGRVKLPNSGKEVTTWAMFTNQQSKLWEESIDYVNQAITYFSDKIGEYPYDSFTAVQSALNAGAGMEYPALTVVGLADDEYALDEVISHEIAHNWFYSSLASNERRYPFMDESITSAYTDRYMSEKYPGKKLWEIILKKRKQARFFHVLDMPIERRNELDWLTQARRNLEQPVNLNSEAYSSVNYSQMIYSKGTINFNYLRANLGDSLFDAIIQDYFLRWRFKHPQPDDLRNEIATKSGKNLDWFFDDLLGTTKRLDYQLVRHENQAVLVRNKGELVSPLVISGMKGDSICFEKWVGGFNGKQWIDLPAGNYTELKIDPNHVMPELYRLNNNLRTTGLFRKSNPVRTQLYLTIEDPDKRTVMYIPAVNYNRENGLMLGLTVHNGFIISKPFEYVIMPFYSLNGGNLAGFGKFAYNITPYNQLIRMATVSLEGSRFAAPGNQNYHKAKIGLDLAFRNKDGASLLNQSAYANYTIASDLQQINLQEKAGMRSFLRFGYQLKKTGFINPYNLLTSIESGKSYQKAAIELNYRYSYYGKNSGLDFRLFAGTMLKNAAESPFYAFAASGRSGREQYFYEGTYPDRFSVFPESFWSRQMTVSEGGLVSPVNERLGYSRWLVSLSITSNLPGKASRFPVKPFVNLILNDHGLTNNYRSPVFGEAGVKAGIWNLFEIWIPFVVTQNIESVTGSFKDRIRIVLKLDSFNRLNLKATKSN